MEIKISKTLRSLLNTCNIIISLLPKPWKPNDRRCAPVLYFICFHTIALYFCILFLLIILNVDENNIFFCICAVSSEQSFAICTFKNTWQNPITSGYILASKINTMRFPLIIILPIREIELNELAEQSPLKQTAAHDESCI